MTPAERTLLELLASIIAPVCRAKPEIEAILTTVRAEWLADPQPITPRAKFVAIETAPAMKDIAAKWKYARCGRDDKWSDPQRDEEKYRKLMALGDNPSHVEVRAILGPTWVYLSCDGCDQSELMRAVRIEGPYGDGHRYCATCISEAAAILGKEL